MDKLSKSSVLSNHKSNRREIEFLIIWNPIRISDIICESKLCLKILFNLRTRYATSQEHNIDGRISKVLPPMGCSCIKKKSLRFVRIRAIPEPVDRWCRRITVNDRVTGKWFNWYKIKLPECHEIPVNTIRIVLV